MYKKKRRRKKKSDALKADKVTLTKKQWEVVERGDGGGIVPFDLYKERTITALLDKHMIYQSDLGYKLTDTGQQAFNRKKLFKYNREKRERQFRKAWERFGDDRLVYYDVEEQRHHCTFIPNRQFRFDVVFPKDKVAVEIQGGTASGGRHVHFAGYEADTEKNNLAIAEGWAVAVITGIGLERNERKCIEIIQKVLAGRFKNAWLGLLSEASVAWANNEWVQLYTRGNYKPTVTVYADSKYFKSMRDHILTNWQLVFEREESYGYKRDLAGGVNFVRQVDDFHERWH